MTVEVIVNPASDAAFVQAVRDLAPGERGDRAFEADLRKLYPLAVVRHGELSGAPVDRWYIYRDGRWAGDGLGFADVGEADEQP